MMLMRLQLQLRPTPWGEIADVVTRCFIIIAALLLLPLLLQLYTTNDDDDPAASHTLQ